jgi:hypothetical protein
MATKFKLNEDVFMIEDDKKIISTVIAIVVRDNGTFYKLSGGVGMIHEGMLQPYKE